MKKLFPFAVAFCMLLSLVGLAQTPNPPASRPAVTPAAPAGGAAPGGGTGAEGKIAFIDTSAFRNGIVELKAKLDTLNAEFEPKNKELQAKKDEIDNLKSKIQTQGATVQPAVRNQWVDEATQKEVLLKRLAEDLDGLAKRRYEEISGPVYDKIGQTLEKYAQQRGIAAIFEVNALSQGQALVFRVAASDVTEDFIREYNKVNPGTGGAASAARKP